MSDRFSSPVHVTVISLGVMLLAWITAAWLTADPMVLPGPAAVWDAIRREVANGELWHHTQATLVRVIMAFCIAMSLGCVFGFVLGKYPKVNIWADPWVTVLLNMPALVVIVLCYLWIGLNETAAIVAVAVNKTAMVTVTIREGVRTLDRSVSEMALVYRMTRLTILRHVVWPQLGPFVASSTRNGLAVIWKIVLVVEFLGRSNGVGFQIHLYFQLFDTATVLAYALTFVAVMLAIEYFIVQRWERRSSAWRYV